MHPAPAFRVSDPKRLKRQLAERPFVTLCASLADGLAAAHAPVVARETADGLRLDFHLSRGNRLAAALDAGFEAVAVSLGPEAYISPDWYAAADQVPTWNYISVEAEGAVTALGAEGLVTLLDDLSAQEEARLAPKPPWTRAKMSPGRFDQLLSGIVGAQMRVRRLEGTFKLSQNKPADERARVSAALGDHPLSGLIV